MYCVACSATPAVCAARVAVVLPLQRVAVSAVQRRSKVVAIEHDACRSHCLGVADVAATCALIICGCDSLVFSVRRTNVTVAASYVVEMKLMVAAVALMIVIETVEIGAVEIRFDLLGSMTARASRTAAAAAAIATKDMRLFVS